MASKYAENLMTLRHSGQTDRQTDRHAHRNSSHPSPGQSDDNYVVFLFGEAWYNVNDFRQ